MTYTAYAGRAAQNAAPYVPVQRTSAYAYIPSSYSNEEAEQLTMAVSSGEDDLNEERIQEILLNGDPT